MHNYDMHISIDLKDIESTINLRKQFGDIRLWKMIHSRYLDLRKEFGDRNTEMDWLELRDKLCYPKLNYKLPLNDK